MSSSVYSRSVLLFLISMLLLIGCTVKEDRSDCPMPLLVVPGMRAENVPVRYHVRTEAETVWNDVFVCGADSTVSIEVPRRILESFASYSKTDFYDREGNYLIPPGSECPEVWTHSAMLDATKPFVSDTVELYRSRACITFIIRGTAGRSQSMALVGKVDGFHNDGRPSTGDFFCKAGETGRMDSAGRWTVGVPRQSDDSLVLEMETSGMYRVFPVGHYLDDSGYDWTAKELEDVTIEIDYADYHIRIRTSAWEHTLTFDIRF